MNKEEKNPPVSVENIYRLNGRVPLQKAIPFGLQHVLAMFVSNLAPVLIVCSAAIVRSTGEHLTSAEITRLLQCAMFAAGIGTCMQLYPIWKIGSRLPIVMGVSFTFLGSLLVICTNPDLGYEGMVGAVIPIVFLVSAAETTGATTAVCTGALGRDIKMEELQGSLAVDGFSSAISGCFGCPPLTSFSQNVGLVTMTGVINRFTIFTGALILILASLFPPLGAFFNSLPQAVLGGCTVMMFGSIMYEGIKMLKECEFDDRTMIIVSLAFCIGVGLTQTSGNFFAAFPQVVGDVFNGNAVAGVFVVSLLLSLLLPKSKKEEK